MTETQTKQFLVYAYNDAFGRAALRGLVGDRPVTVEASYNGREYALVEASDLFDFVDVPMFSGHA